MRLKTAKDSRPRTLNLSSKTAQRRGQHNHTVNNRPIL